MSPLQGIEGVESQFWAIHRAMKLAFSQRIHHVIIECDNIVAFDLLADQDEEELEEEGLLVAAQQINLLYFEYNKVRDPSEPKMSCKIYTVYATRNRAPAYLAEYGLHNCSSLVHVPVPFGDLHEILDLDMGFGPHLDAFDISPNFGLGEVSNQPQVYPSPSLQHSTPQSLPLASPALDNFEWPPFHPLLINAPFPSVFFQDSFSQPWSPFPRDLSLSSSFSLPSRGIIINDTTPNLSLNPSAPLIDASDKGKAPLDLFQPVVCTSQGSSITWLCGIGRFEKEEPSGSEANKEEVDIIVLDD